MNLIKLKKKNVPTDETSGDTLALDFYNYTGKKELLNGVTGELYF